jgi:hypothetical protein
VRIRRHQSSTPIESCCLASEKRAGCSDAEAIDEERPVAIGTVQLSYSPSSDVALLSLVQNLEFSDASFIQSPDVFVVVRDGVVVGLLLRNAARAIDEEQLTVCGGLDTLALPRLGDEPF